MSAPDRDPWPESVGHGAGQPPEPVANGHRWPCPGFYTGNHEPGRVGLWACICTESPSPAPVLVEEPDDAPPRQNLDDWTTVTPTVTEADPAAGERCRRCECRHLCMRPEACPDAPATPDAGDASITPGGNPTCPKCGRWYGPGVQHVCPDASGCQHCGTESALVDCPVHGEESTSASEPLSEDVEALLADSFGEWLHRMHGVVSSCDHVTEARGLIEALGPWLAAREAKARAEAGEQIAQAIEALSGNHVRIARAARIAREVTRPATPGPVDWDSPTWGGGTHAAAWAPDGRHDDNAQED